MERTVIMNGPSWKDLQKAAAHGRIKSYVKTGDVYHVATDNGYEKFDIPFVATYDKKEKLFFVSARCLPLLCSMECRGATTWAESYAREYLNNEFFSRLPADLQEVIVPTRIEQHVDGKKYVTEDKVFLLSANQVLNENAYVTASLPDCEAGESRLDIFTGPASLVRDGFSRWGTSAWWLRTPDKEMGRFLAITESGGWTPSSSQLAQGIVPAFRIG